MTDEGWRPINTAPKDRSILVFAPERDGLPAFQCVCRWHTDAGFTVDEIRIATYWRPLPAPPCNPCPEKASGGWRPAKTAPYDTPVVVRQSDGEVHVARKLPDVMGRADIWSRSPYPPVCVTGWRPIEPEPAPELAEAAARMAEALKATLYVVEAFATVIKPLANDQSIEMARTALATYEAAKEKTDG